MSALVISDRCGFFDLDCRDRFRIINCTGNLTGIICRDAEGLEYAELVCPEDRDEVLSHLNYAVDNGSCCIQHRIILPDMSVIMVKTSLKYSDGLINAAMSRVNDIITGDNVLYKSNHALESMAISTAVLLISSGGNISIKYANDEFYNMIGWNRLEFKEYFNENLHDIIFNADADDFYKKIRSLVAEKSPNDDFMVEIRTVSSDGVIRWNEVHAKYITQENGNGVVSCIFSDITNRRRLQNELSLQNERFRIIQSSSEQLIFDYDTERDIMIFNGSVDILYNVLGLYDIEKKPNELIVYDYIKSGCPRSFMSSDDYKTHCDAFANAIISKDCTPFDFLMCLDGDSPSQWYRCIYSTVKNDLGEVLRIVGRFKNIDKQKKNEIIVEKRMRCDFLTGLLNKETAVSAICEFINQNDSSDDKLHAVMIIDIDNFRTINDRFGHSFGDSVIQEFASDIKSSFRDTDIVGRIGGDEFLILMKNVTLKSASKKAGRLCRSLVRNYSVNGQDIGLSCSIGLSFYGRDSNCFEELYKYADIAMYTAKVNGRCSYRLYDKDDMEMHTELSETQNRTLMDPPANYTETSELDTNLLDIAFSLMAASDDVFGTIDILMRTVGRKYNLSSVTLLLYDNENNSYKVKNKWFSNKHLSNMKLQPFYEPDMSFEDIFIGSNLKCVSDVSASSLSPALKNSFKNHDIRAFVIGRLEGRGLSKYGYMAFVQRERKRKWSRKETNTFKYITKIISVALADRYFASKNDDMVDNQQVSQ